MGQRTSYAPGATSTLAIGVASAQSGALSNAGYTSKARASTYRVVSDTDCFLVFGANPTATSAGLFLPARSVEYFDIPAGSKIAAIRATADGTLNITATSELEG